jgi:mercuric ion transport protein
MPTLADRVRGLLPSSLAGLAGVACAACCALPLLLGAGVLSGAGWAAAGDWMPGIAVLLAALAGTAPDAPVGTAPAAPREPARRRAIGDAVSGRVL